MRSDSLLSALSQRRWFLGGTDLEVLAPVKHEGSTGRAWLSGFGCSIGFSTVCSIGMLYWVLYWHALLGPLLGCSIEVLYCGAQIWVLCE